MHCKQRLKKAMKVTRGAWERLGLYNPHLLRLYLYGYIDGMGDSGSIDRYEATELTSLVNKWTEEAES